MTSIDIEYKIIAFRTPEVVHLKDSLEVLIRLKYFQTNSKHSKP